MRRGLTPPSSRFTMGVAVTSTAVERSVREARNFIILLSRVGQEKRAAAGGTRGIVTNDVTRLSEEEDSY